MIDFIWNCIKPFLFLFDAERVHRWMVHVIQWGLATGGAPLRIAAGSNGLNPPAQRPLVFGIEFESRVGLAAGFDKDAEIVRALPLLGFGFAELGTVTPRPQPGNPKPRLFRDLGRTALFNRMGFNGAGAEEVARTLERARDQGLPPRFRVGINIGKNKDTPLEEAAKDYRDAVSPFRGLVDYVVINVSSPNTPGLRSLQTAEGLRPLIHTVQEEITKWEIAPPLLLKLAPEVSDEDLQAVVQMSERAGVAGWVMSNTLAGVWVDGVSGGWSGAPLEVIARDRLVALRKLTSRPIISVGGILSEDEGRRRISLGADLIQIYSGWIFRGPRFPARLSQATLDTASRRSLP